MTETRYGECLRRWKGTRNHRVQHSLAGGRLLSFLCVSRIATSDAPFLAAFAWK